MVLTRLTVERSRHIRIFRHNVDEVPASNGILLGIDDYGSTGRLPPGGTEKTKRQLYTCSRSSCQRRTSGHTVQSQVLTKERSYIVQRKADGGVNLSWREGGGHADLPTCDFHRVPMFSRQSIALE
jgi:hypothetical protein